MIKHMIKIRQIRSENIPKDVKIKYIENFDKIEDMLKNIPQDKVGIFNTIFQKLTSKSRKILDMKNIEELVEDLMENKLHMSHAKIETLL
jgi:hypothetical protein